jgi:hypothetical protein
VELVVGRHYVLAPLPRLGVAAVVRRPAHNSDHVLKWDLCAEQKSGNTEGGLVARALRRPVPSEDADDGQ